MNNTKKAKGKIREIRGVLGYVFHINTNYEDRRKLCASIVTGLLCRTFLNLNSGGHVYLSSYLSSLDKCDRV